VAARLGALDSVGMLQLSIRPTSAQMPSVAGLVIAAPSAMTLANAAELDAVADVILHTANLDGQLTGLFNNRIAGFAADLAGSTTAGSAAVLEPADPRWATVAGRYLDRLRAALDSEKASAGTTFEHIGSTAVPGLSAKPIIDLQMQVPELRHDAAFDEALRSVGFRPAEGSRPDSPGVYRDLPRGRETVAGDVWDKRLFVRPDPGQPSILHIRKALSPWGRYTILFRDWLRAHPAQRSRYQQTKLALADAHAGDPDYDDYTRAKTDYFDRVQAEFEGYGADEVGTTAPSVAAGRQLHVSDVGKRALRRSRRTAGNEVSVVESGVPEAGGREGDRADGDTEDPDPEGEPERHRVGEQPAQRRTDDDGRSVERAHRGVHPPL
jgi:dephospho-CoA kinase